VTPPAGFRGAFRDDAAARAVYAEAAGIAQLMPDAVAVPADADDVVTLVRWADRTGTALIARGSGSSMGGGAIGRGVIVDLGTLAERGPIDVAARRCQVGPGVIAADVDRAATAVGLRFPVDPSSWTFCTVGGMVATNAAGAHTFAFGPMRRWVTALDCVFADGTRAVVRRGAPPPSGIPAVARLLADVRPSLAGSGRVGRVGVRKDSSGYGIDAYLASGDLVDLLVGSEGTLALFVGIELALAPRPAATASLLAVFPSLAAAVAGTAAARAAAETASRAAADAVAGPVGGAVVACELLDRTFLDVAAAGGAGRRVPAGTEAALLIELEAGHAGDGDAEAARCAVDAAASALAAALRDAGASGVDLALDPAAEEALWALRHAASPILARLDPSLKSMQFIEDGAVPPDRLAEYVLGVRAALERQGIRGVIFGHAGDAHVHVNPLIDVRQPDWRLRLDALLADVTALTARLGGTLTGEHGDGRLRTPLMTAVWPAATLALFAAIKRAFDPRGILNPGVKVPLAGQRAVGDVKYDPALPPLPDVARAVLARVERERLYARGRLALLAEAASPLPALSPAGRAP